MTTFRGLVYVKHGRVGTRSEGPDYYLQTHGGDLLLRLQDRSPWAPDYQLEFYGRRMVEIEGKRIDPRTVQVASIRELLSPHLPRPGQAEPHLGAPFELAPGESVRLADAPLTITLRSVDEDSRCPIGVTCVWQGQCVITLSIEREGEAAQSVSLTARAGEPELAAREVFGYRIELHDVRPYPTREAPQPPRYTASIEVDAIA